MSEQNKELGMCPHMSSHDLITCLGYVCEIWDEDRECCSYNSKVLNITIYEKAAVSRIKDRIKVEILRMLEQKTGWGRVELKTALFDLVDGIEDESSL